MSLTFMQMHLLQILADVEPNALTGQEVLDIAGADTLMLNPWASREGVHQTASSLSRRGLIVKHNPAAIPQRGISYAISIAGKTALATQKEARRSGIKPPRPSTP